MTYADIIKNTQDSLDSSINWWAKFAFHFTDIKNAVKILELGKMYSRTKVNEKNIMKNDNASYSVISMTSPEVQDYVRFYFRPLTPTQYYNEGYKHPEIRYDQGLNANIPIPIFFMFDLNKLLEDPFTKFSENGEAGHGAPMLSGIDNFAKLAFGKIYGHGPMQDVNEEKKYRQAEILYPNSYDIDASLMYIVCRNKFEQSMLVSMLDKQNRKLLLKYGNRIKVYSSNNLFQKNGVFLNDIQFTNNILGFLFENNPAKRRYVNGYYSNPKRNFLNDNKPLSPLKLLFTFEWKNPKQIIEIKSVEHLVDYVTLESVMFKLPDVENATKLTVTVTCNGDLIGFKDIQLTNIM